MENKTCSKPPTSYCFQLSITNETINQMTIGCIPVMSPKNIMDISWIYHGYGTSTPTSFALAHQGRDQDRADHEGIQQDTGDDPRDSGQ